jgi:hypothetical protein
MALRSLRPVEVGVRVEDPGGAAASRTITRVLLADGVKVRRWKGDVAGSLYLPAAGTGATAAALLIDAREDDGATPAAPVVAALLSSRGVLVFLATGSHGEPAAVFAALPSPPETITTMSAAELPVPPGAGATPDAAAWDALLERLAATPRRLRR